MKMKAELAEASVDELLEAIHDLEVKLRKKTEDLTRTRDRLNKSRSNVKRLKEIINYQRQRILQLYDKDLLP